MAAIIRGFGALDKKLAALGDARTVQKVVRQAVVFALTPVVKSAKANIPQGTDSHVLRNGRVVSPGFASRSIKKKIKKGFIGDGYLIQGLVGVRASAWYSTLYDTGFTRVDGTKVTGDDWLTDAGKDNVDVMIARFNTKLAKAIIKEAKKNV